MKYFVFADVHGFYSILKKELEKQGFDENNENHMLISLGDNFDRGEENYEMFLFLKKMYEKNKIILIKGNHEDLFIDMLISGCVREVDKRNGTYGTLNELYKKVFNVDNEITFGDYLDTYRKLKEIGFISLIDSMEDYYETNNYVFTHGFIPINGTWTYYYNENCEYNPNWRNVPKLGFKDARWINGIEMSIKYKIGEPNKKIVVGHFHASYGNVRKDLPSDLPDSILKKYEFSNLEYFKPYIDERIIAIDACTVLTKKINVYVIED